MPKPKENIKKLGNPGKSKHKAYKVVTTKPGTKTKRRSLGTARANRLSTNR